MTFKLDRKDIISLLRGITPPYSVMNKIPKELGSYIGGFADHWEWNYIDENTPYTDEYLFNLYLMCKNGKEYNNSETDVLEMLEYGMNDYLK